MPTEAGKAFVLQRLSDAPDREALLRAYESLGDDYRNDAEVKAVKGKLELKLK